ncbi:insulinase family protein [Altererythrobacter sp. ZODW24]|uniref:M16 family metallopeptidase n=1 Tax=Altererythrobacter sp. ZODW24 TaxID=2185142 RepID=UPI0013B3AA00|nr:insulinase family protein [Altererythrobacter sp. ZODW24]
MRYIKPALLVSVPVLLAGCAAAGDLRVPAVAPTTPATQALEQAPAFAHMASDLPPDARVTYGQLKNGVRYAVMHNDTPSGAGALRMRFGTGSLEETEEQQGIAHFLEHMAFNGSRNVPEGEMIKRLERFGLSFGADTNASTGFDQTTYKLNLSNVRDEVLNEAFFLMRETADGLLLDADAIERERGVIASEKRARDSLVFRSTIDQLGFLTKGSGLVDRLPIGKNETIATMPREEFVRFYQSYYHPENTFIVFVGDVETSVAIDKIESYFGDWQPEMDLVPPRPVTPAQTDGGRIGYYQHPELLTFTTLGTLYPYVDRPDNFTNRRESMLRTLGQRMLNRRFSRMIDAGDTPFLSASVSRYAAQETVDGMILRVRSDPDKWAAATAAADLEVRRAIEHGFSRAELDEQIAVARQATETAVERADTRKSFANQEYNYASALSSAFAGERVFTSPETNLANFETVMESISLADVKQTFRERWQGYDDPVVYLSTSEELADPESQIASALEASRKVAAAPLENRSPAAFVHTEFGKPGEVVSDTYLEDADAHLIRFANNVRLNFKQTDFDTGTINIHAQVGDGFFSLPRNDEGFRRFAGNVLSGSGVDGHTNDDLRTLFAGKRVGARLLLRIDSDAFDIIGATDKEHLADQLNLMTARAAAPGFREETASRFRDTISAWYPTHDSTPNEVAKKEIPRLIRSGDSRYGYGDLQDFQSPTLDQVRAWTEPQLKTGFIEITVVGDVDKDTLIAEVARTFGALPVRSERQPDYEDERALAFAAAPDEPVRLTHTGNDDQALVRVYWPVPGATAASTYYQLLVLRSILRNRLTDVLREELGSTYSPAVGIEANPQIPGFGYVLAHVTTSPEQTDIVLKATREVGRKLAAEGVTSDEVSRAVQPLIEDLSSSLESNSYWLGALNDAQSDRFGLERFRQRETTYRAVTTESLQSLAAQIFGQGRSYPVFVLPDVSDDR